LFVEGNLYGDDIKLKLIELQDSAERGNYTMQDRIYPFVSKNYFVYPEKLDNLEEVDVVDEIGIFGAFVRLV
jgi:hypothetical protein